MSTPHSDFDLDVDVDVELEERLLLDTEIEIAGQSGTKGSWIGQLLEGG